MSERTPVTLDFSVARPDARCAVAVGYDVDMPGNLDYLQDPETPWRTTPGTVAVHGHLTDDVGEYIRLLATIAEQHNAKLQFFLQGNTLEDPLDLWQEIADRGHALDQHTYSHLYLPTASVEEAQREVADTARLLRDKLGIDSRGMRGPGGYPDGLVQRPDIQQAILDIGLEWVTTHVCLAPVEERTPGDAAASLTSLRDYQPYRYESGLLEIPFCGWSDRQFLDVDMGGTARPDEWIAYLKQGVDFAHEHGLAYSLCVHPSTGMKHDPEGHFLDQLLSHCATKTGTIVCTYRELHEWARDSQAAKLEHS